MMKNTEITNYSELMLRIEYLKAEKTKQEEDLKITFKEFVNTLDPLTMLKHSLHKLAEDKDVQLDLTKVGVSIGTSFIINKIFNRNNSIKGFLSSIIVNLLSSKISNESISKIISVITNLIHNKFGEKEEETREV